MATTAELVTQNPFSSFAPSPLGVSFEEQEKEERILLLSRAHPITLVPVLVLTIFLIIAPLILGNVLGLLHIDFFVPFSGGQIFLLWAFWYLLVITGAFYRFVFWYFNVYLITNQRIIDFDFIGLLSKKIAFCRLEQIEDVTPKTVGFFGTFFNFGNVLIQTAAEQQQFEFENVAMPDAVSEVIFKQLNLEEKGGGVK